MSNIAKKTVYDASSDGFADISPIISGSFSVSQQSGNKAGMLAEMSGSSIYMRSKPLLSHSPLWFPTVPAIFVGPVTAALAHAQSQEQAKQATPAPATLPRILVQRRSSAANPAGTATGSDRLKVRGRTDRFVHFEKEVEMTRKSASESR
jgi:hypothetical protein